ncbi:MAG: Hsp20/alpha crystallin family protein [Alistipes sp.]|nr:Hsp20/alpha crystallin family protein [Alistipes sp.]
MVPVIKNRNWMPNWLDDFFGDDWALNRNNQMASPSVNIIENERCFCIEIAAPGMTKEDFRVSLNEGSELVVSLEKCSDNKPARQEGESNAGKEKQTYLRREFSYGAFRRSFILPENVEKSKIAATMKNGILAIELPKREEAKHTPAVREIAIG